MRGVLLSEPQNAQACSAKRERIAGPGRLLASGEELDELIELVGKRNRDCDRCGGRGIVRAARGVVVTHGGCDYAVLIGVCVIPAHHALQLRKFADHARRKIRLAQQPRAAAMLDRRSYQRRDFARDALQPQGPFVLRADLCVERHGF